MKIFASESELVQTLDKYDQLILDCVAGKILFKDFLKNYSNFYMEYALDGHEF